MKKVKKTCVKLIHNIMKDNETRDDDDLKKIEVKKTGDWRTRNPDSYPEKHGRC